MNGLYVEPLESPDHPLGKPLSASVASRILIFVPSTGSSHIGPSRVAHWNPCTMLDRQEFSSTLSTSLGSVSMSIFVPCVGESPKAHTDLDVRRSQLYLVWKNRPSFFLSQFRFTIPASKCSAKPSSIGSAMKVSLFRLFAVEDLVWRILLRRHDLKSLSSISLR